MSELLLYASTFVIAYLFGGATGIVASMWMHKRTVGRRQVGGYQPKPANGPETTPPRIP